MTEQELAAALERTYGITAGHAAELAAAHHGRLRPTSTGSRSISLTPTRPGARSDSGDIGD